MKRLFLLILIIPGLSLTAQPRWMNETVREMEYPSSDYYTGFANERWSGDPDLSVALESVKLNARKNLSESILVTVSGSASTEGSSYQLSDGKTTSEMTRQKFSQKIQSSTASILVSQDVKTYFDAKTSMLYAFTTVKKSDLAAYYARRISDLCEKAESLFRDSESLTGYGKIREAKEKLSLSRQEADTLEPYFILLSAVNPNHPALHQFSEVLSLYNRICERQAGLDKGPSIAVKDSFLLSGTDDDAFRSDPRILVPRICQSLSESGYLLAEEGDAADYELRIETSTSLRSRPVNGFGILSYYVNVSGQLTNLHTGKEIITFTIFRDPNFYAAGPSPESAAGRAFQSPTLKETIVNKILKSLEK